MAAIMPLDPGAPYPKKDKCANRFHEDHRNMEHENLATDFTEKYGSSRIKKVCIFLSVKIRIFL
jgi:hypothetical protein